MRRALMLLLAAGAAPAHVGSPDVFFEGSAGPYPLFVTIRPPVVIPGIAQIEIRSGSPGVREIRITPTPLTGEGAKHAPTPDVAERSKQDPQFYSGTLWLMSTGSWQVRIFADGARGRGELNVPVPAAPTRTKPMLLTLGAGLFAMMIVLAAGLISIVGASVREGQLEPGAEPDTARRRRARMVMGVTAVLALLAIYGGNSWWNAEASDYARYLYKPLDMTASVEPQDKLMLTLRDPGWLRFRKLDDFLPDHNHLMHLYVIRKPEIDRVWHLHPEMTASGRFTQYLPPMPAGNYRLYGDVVHRNGFPETLVAELNLPAEIKGAPLSGDDAGGTGGSAIVWDMPAEIRAGKPEVFRFRLTSGDAELYMGMRGHAAFVKDDGTVFAHVHPSGSVPMAALELANPGTPDHSGHQMKIPPEAGFPYAFPKPGTYHVIVQMKHTGAVETGIFEAEVR